MPLPSSDFIRLSFSRKISYIVSVFSIRILADSSAKMHSLKESILHYPLIYLSTKTACKPCNASESHLLSKALLNLQNNWELNRSMKENIFASRIFCISLWKQFGQMGIKRRVTQGVQFFYYYFKKQHRERWNEEKTNLGWVSNVLRAKSAQIWMNL